MPKTKKVWPKRVKKIKLDILKRYMPGCGMYWNRRWRAVTRRKATDFRVIRAMKNLGINLANASVQLELAMIFVTAFKMVSVLGPERQWGKVRQFVGGLYRYYRLQENRIGQFMRYDDFEDLFMAIASARYCYVEARKAEGKSTGVPLDKFTLLVFSVDKFLLAWEELPKVSTDDMPPLEAMRDAVEWPEGNQTNADGNDAEAEVDDEDESQDVSENNPDADDAGTMDSEFAVLSRRLAAMGLNQIRDPDPNIIALMRRLENMKFEQRDRGEMDDINDMEDGDDKEFVEADDENMGEMYYGFK
ncbi:hypothetical protein VTJ04DRAFT_5115 [Mycothermus thermophilus]|uniref:uncharacterized protein n=1 Tax=Humicola insolens TaxID=85995 RepID=UPI003743D80D